MHQSSTNFLSVFESGKRQERTLEPLLHLVVLVVGGVLYSAPAAHRLRVGTYTHSQQQQQQRVPVLVCVCVCV